MAKILIVDDSLLIRRNLRTILEQESHSIIEVNSGEAAVEAYKSHKPDLVTMDITMSGMTGLEAVQKILKHDPVAKIIVVSALNDKRTVVEAINFGAKNYVIKPFDAQKVLTTINAVLHENKREGKKQ